MARIGREAGRGFTLVEAVIYIALLSGLLSAFIPYAYAIRENDTELVGGIMSAAAAP